jgi:hypothetical protein
MKIITLIIYLFITTFNIISLNKDISKNLIDIIKNENKKNSILNLKLYLKDKYKDKLITNEQYNKYIEFINIISNNKEFNYKDLINLAINLNNKDLIEDLILQYNIDISIINNTSLIEFILESDDTKIIDIISKDKNGIKYIVDNSYILYSSIINNRLNIIEYILKNGIDINRKIQFSRVPIVLAAAINKKYIIKMFIKHNANINLKENDYITALTRTIANNYIDKDIINILLKNNIDINWIDIIIAINNNLEFKYTNISKLIFQAKILDIYYNAYINYDYKINIKYLVFKIINIILDYIYYKLSSFTIDIILPNNNLYYISKIFIESNNSNLCKNNIYQFINNLNFSEKTILYKRFLNKINLYKFSKIIALNIENGIIDTDKISIDHKNILEDIIKSLKLIKNDKKIKRFINIKDLILIYLNRYKEINYKIENLEYKYNIENRLILEIIKNLNSYKDITMIFLLFKKLH